MIKKKDDLCVLGVVIDIHCDMDNKMRWYCVGGHLGVGRHRDLLAFVLEREGEVTTVCQR